MGISGLFAFLKKKYPSLIEVSHISQFSYEKIPVEVSPFMYKIKSTAGDNGSWINYFISLICLFKTYTIHATFVFEGEAPPEKDEEACDRYSAKEKLEDKSLNLALAIEEFEHKGIVLPILSETMKYIEEKGYFQKVSESLLHPTLKEHERDSEGNKKVIINIDHIKKYLLKIERQAVHIDEDDIKKLKSLFDQFEIPYIQSPTEGETLCSKWCIDGKCKGVVSEDSDIIAYGTPIFISKLDTTGYCEVIKYERVLKETGFTSDQFLDFCIMCSCDYNKNIPGVGPVGAFKMIEKYKSLEKAEKNSNLDFSKLRYKRCRAIFRFRSKVGKEDDFKEYKEELKYWGKPDIEILMDYLKSNNCRYNKDTLTSLWKPRTFSFK